MRRSFLLVLAAAGLPFAPGCGHLDLARASDPHRVIAGTVNVRMNLIPPEDAEVVVRVVQPAGVSAAPARAGGDLVIGQRGTGVRPEQVIAEQTVHAPARMPVPFRVAFRADEAQLRRGLNIEARISWGGRVRFRNREAQLVTLATPDQPVQVWVEPLP